MAIMSFIFISTFVSMSFHFYSNTKKIQSAKENKSVLKTYKIKAWTVETIQLLVVVIIMPIFSFLPQKMLFYLNCFKINRKITFSLYDLTLSALSRCSFHKVMWYHPVLGKRKGISDKSPNFYHMLSPVLHNSQGHHPGLPGNFSQLSSEPEAEGDFPLCLS